MRASLTLALGALAAGILAACPTPPGPGPAPVVPPDADAAPTSPVDASPAPLPTTPCQIACEAMGRFCGSRAPDCEAVMAHIDGARAVRNAHTGRPLTCLDVASAESAAELRAMGLPCGGH